MIYRIIKKMHIASACVGFLLWLSASGTSDLAKELGKTNPQIVDTLIIIGALCCVPTVMYLILDYIKENYINVNKNR